MILTVKNGGFSYKNGERILDSVNFSVKEGEILAILGPNGAGKTTLLRCTMGFLNWNEGTSALDGENIKNIPPRRLWKNIAYVPQAKSAVSPYTVEETIMLGRGSHMGVFNAPGIDDMKIVEDVINKLHLGDIRKKKCGEISGGELQMVLIAKALAAEPRILILDEPESNLDFRNQLLVLDTMSALAQKGMACIFNTHYPAHALQRAEKALIINKKGGSVFGCAQNVVTEENIEKAFGVKTVIGEVETDTNILQDIIPLEIAMSEGKLAEHMCCESKLAVISVAAGTDSAEKINEILSTGRKYIVGRMGMPNREYGVNIINIILDGPEYELREITARLNAVRGVGVKTVYVNKKEQV